MNEQDVGVHIDVYSDVICPWCFIGKRRLEQALEEMRPAQAVQVKWRPFELNPTMPKGGMDRRSYLEAKFGGAASLKTMEERVAQAGEAEGIEFAFDRIALTPNTFDAHRLIWFAGQQGCQDKVVEALFFSYFTEGRDIGNLDSLTEVAVDGGLNREEVLTFLSSDKAVQEVRAEEANGQRFGIRGVPYFLLNGSLSISGAQPPDIILSALRQAEGIVMERLDQRGVQVENHVHKKVD
ncbi:MAG: DsbA family oxidoreductase [Nitrospirae bacterium]|nr:DsbA family oxidoreductase [Nitrospirota bacterium]